MPEPSNGPRPLVRAMGHGDLEAVAVLHGDALRYGLFPRLGRRFLRSYHAALLDSPAAVSLVASDDRGVAGFLVGSFDHHEHQHWMLRSRGLRLAAAGTVGLLTHPAALLLFVRTRLRRYLRRLQRAFRTSPTATSGGATHLRLGVLLHVAVAVDRRGEGVGRLLTERFVTDAKGRAADELQLVTADGGAATFYRRLGWEERQTRRDRDGTAVTTFGYQLTGTDGPTARR